MAAPHIRQGKHRIGCAAHGRAYAAHHAVKGFLRALFILPALGVGDVLHYLEVLGAGLGTGIAANVTSAPFAL